MLPAGGGLFDQQHSLDDLNWGSSSISVTLNKPLNSKKSVFSLAKQE